MEWIEWKRPAIGEPAKIQAKRHNSSSMAAFARALMAKEWARVLGKRPAQLKPKKDGLYGSR